MNDLRSSVGSSARRVVRGHPGLWRAVRKVRSRVGDLLPPRSVPGIEGRFHRNDTMIRTYGKRLTADTARRYLAAGADTAELVESHLGRATGRDVGATGTWLEIGSGYGRILRTLVDDVSPDRIWAADIDPGAVAFCEAELKVRGRVVTVDFRGLEGIQADAVFAISVATHIDERPFRRFLTMIGEVVAPGGAVLFTTMGPHSLAHLEWYDEGAYVPERERLESTYAERGMAYVPYGYVPDGSYGLTWHDPAFVRAAMGDLHGDRFAEVAYEPHALEGHQDVWVYRDTRRSAD